MKLNKYSESCDYFTHVIPITVNALAITSWNVTPNASWISVVDAGNGKGGDTVSIAVGENPSWKARTGTVKIGTETFTVTQEGRTALEFKLNPTTATASVTGGNGVLAVNATPDLPWTAKSGANWLTIMSGYTSGAGNGNVVYNASPNSTLSKRTGTITVTPGDSSLNAKTLTVTQPAADAAISKTSHEFPAAGGSVAVDVTVGGIVEWSVTESISWLSVEGATSRVGPGTVVLSATANDTVYPRSGTLKIAGKTFSVVQQARGVELEYDSKVFGTDGGMESISIHPDGNVSWTAVASDNWIVVFQNASGTGDAEVIYILAPYEGDGSPRTGWITIGDKKVYITQRAYDVDITPKAEYVNGNSGAGEIGVSAGIGDVWQAIIEAPWIKIITGYDAGSGNGTVRFTYTENNTGLTRTGKIVIAGEVYTLTQAARIPVAISASVEGHGTVSGTGEYTLGDKVSLTATPDAGYEFLYWTGDCGESMQNPLPVTADVVKSVTAHFGPLTPEFTKTETSTAGVTLTWRGLAWATQYKIYRAPTDVFPSVALVTLDAKKGTTWQDTTGDAGKTYFYWVEAIGPDDTTECKDATSGAKQKPIVYSSITYTNLKGATHANPATYQEGTTVSFSVPSAVTGYTFTGWTPSAITATMTGSQAVMANWKANTYTISYNANGGSGAMAGTSAVYDQNVTLPTNAFVKANHVFQGWATGPGEEVSYAAGATVRNLTALQSGVVTLYAVWEYVAPVDTDPGENTPPEWEPVTKEDTMVAYLTVYDKVNGKYLEATGSVLAAFDKNGECRGKTVVMTGPKGLIYQLSIGVESVAEKGFALKLWDAATGEVIGIGKTLDCNIEKQIGAINNPFELVLGGESVTVSVKEGWNWLAAHVTPEKAGVGDVLSSLTMYDDDVIKSSRETATYYGGVWYPSTFAIEPGKAYMLRKSRGGTEELTVEGEAMEDGVAVAEGWNWIGLPVGTATGIGSVTHTAGFADEDVVKSSGMSATYFDGQWYPSSFMLAPGVGYKLKVANAGSLHFPSVKTGARLLKAARVALASAGGGRPDWEPVVKEDTLILYATVLDAETENALDAEGSLLAAFDAKGECRGVTQVMNGPRGRLYQLSVGVEAASEKGFTLKLWNAASSSVAEIEGTFDSNAEKQIGGIVSPVSFRTKATSIIDPPIEGVTFAEALDEEKLFDVETAEDESWVVISRADGKVGSSCVRGGLVETYDGTGADTTLFASVRGTGTMSFWWKSSCDADPEGVFSWDHASFLVDGVVVAQIDGITGWQQVSYAIAGPGVHSVSWVYSADGYEPEVVGAEDCVWIDGVSWSGEGPTEPLPPLVDPVIDPANGTIFSSDTCTVTISCATPDVTIYYSTNGRTPSVTEANRYTGPFTVDKTTTVKAVAVRGEEKSAYVSATITKEIPLTIHYTIVYCANGATGEMPSVSCTQDEVVTLADCGFVRSGYAFTGWATSATGPVTYSAGTKVSNLATTDGGQVNLYAVWEYLPLVDPVITPTDGTTFNTDTCEVTISCASVDSVLYYSTSGRTPSTTETYRYKGPFTIDKTTTVKAVAVRGGEKSAYVSATITKEEQVVGETQTTEVPIPYAWLKAKFPGVGNAASDMEAKALATAVNGRKVWECYVAGEDPTDAQSRFKGVVTLADGKVFVSWTPDLNTNGVTRIYTVYGCASLEKGEWETPAKPWHRFFKVTVAMPTGTEGEESAVSGEGFVPEEEPLDGVQLWENGPYWAECNVGATKPEEYGYYFWWGDTVGYARSGDAWVSGEGSVANGSPFTSWLCPTYGKDNSLLKSLGYTDAMDNLVAEHDAATIHLGSPWRMPTAKEVIDLYKNCTVTWTMRNGVSGCLVTGKGAAYLSKSIFLPAAGDHGHDGEGVRYWTSTLGSNMLYAKCFYGELLPDDCLRYVGMPIRPVR